MGCVLSAGHTTSASRCSKLPSSTKSGWPRQNEKKPSEVSSGQCPKERQSEDGRSQEQRPGGVSSADVWKKSTPGGEHSWQRAQARPR